MLFRNFYMNKNSPYTKNKTELFACVFNHAKATLVNVVFSCNQFCYTKLYHFNAIKPLFTTIQQ